VAVVYSKPKASIILPVRNEEGNIGLSLESLLAQKEHDIEILVIDNGSQDATLEIANSYNDMRIRIIDTAGLTLSESLNIGVDESNADICIRMDGDDMSYPHRVSLLCSAHEVSDRALIIGSNCKYMTGNKISKQVSSLPLSTNHIRWRCLIESPFMHPAISFKRKRFIDRGYKYPKGYECCEDYALWCQIVFDEECENLSSCLLAYRLCTEKQGNPKKRQLQLSGHDNIIRKCFEEKMGINMSLSEAHIIRTLLVTNEYAKVGKYDKNIITRVSSILMSTYEQFIARGWDRREIFDEHRLLQECLRRLSVMIDARF